MQSIPEAVAVVVMAGGRLRGRRFNSSIGTFFHSHRCQRSPFCWDGPHFWSPVPVNLQKFLLWSPFSQVVGILARI